MCLFRLMNAIEQSLEKSESGGTGQTSSGMPNSAAASSMQHIIPIEEKKLRVKHNLLLAEYFKANAKDPYNLKDKLIDQLEKTLNGETVIGPAPIFVPQEPKNQLNEEASPENKELNLLLNALQSKNAGNVSVTQPSNGNNLSYSQGSSAAQTAPCDINSVLVYNIAAMCYQT